jgi:hypothetical protein
MKKNLQIPTSTRAAITSNSYNEADHTIEVVFATEIEVKRRTWDGAKYIEVLECKEGSVRLDRANAGANLIDSHRTYGVDSILGVVERAWVEGKQCKAMIRLSKREECAGVVKDIVDGIIRNISVGYFIHETKITETDDEVNVRVTDWEPYEITVLSVPADHTAGVRSAETQPNTFHEINFNSNNTRTMDPEEAPVTVPNEESRAAQPTAADTEAVRKAAATAERKRIAEITGAVRTAGIEDEEFLSGMIERGISVPDASVEIIARLAEGQRGVRSQQQATITADSADKRRAAMSVALEHRANPSVELKDGAADFRGLTLLDMARECAEGAGIKTRGMSQREVAETALGVRGYHSSSDFPIILGNTVNRVLRREYDIQERTFSRWASRGSAKDFREMERISLGEVGNFKEVKEGGEYEYTTLSEGKERYKVVKFGQKIAITWETLINDDLSAFSRIPRKISAAAARKQSDIVYNLLTGSYTMGDGRSLFHADHKNLAAGSIINVDNIGGMRKLLRKQKGLGEKDVLNLVGKYLLVGPDNEQLALQYTSANYVANTPTGQNVWAGTLTPIVEDRITGNAWFMAADSSMIDTIEYAFLEGESEVFTEQRVGFDVDGLEIKARMVFGAAPIDFRGLVKNPGQ